MANKWVYMFSEGDMTMRNLLGGKGANLAEMTSGIISMCVLEKRAYL